MGRVGGGDGLCVCVWEGGGGRGEEGGEGGRRRGESMETFSRFSSVVRSETEEEKMTSTISKPQHDRSANAEVGCLYCQMATADSAPEHCCGSAAPATEKEQPDRLADTLDITVNSQTDWQTLSTLQ